MDQVTKVIAGVGEVGIDTESSEGNGRYYAKMFNGDFDASGFDTEEEALDELMYAAELMRDMDDDFPMSLEYDDDAFEGEYL